MPSIDVMNSRLTGARGGDAEGGGLGGDEVPAGLDGDDDARPGEDHHPGRDRRHLRAYRLPPVLPSSPSRFLYLTKGELGRFNAYFALKAEDYKPISPPGITNRMWYRPLEGFVASISPFNFTAIGGNLASCPAMMGNAVLWKPSDTAVLSNYTVFKLLREAGVPPGVIQFLPADGPVFGDAVTDSPDLACINFTGSVPTFCHLWKQVHRPHLGAVG